MSSDAIIEGLKQGNTVELDVLQNMKEGLNSVVDKMISECLSRNDGLSELTEKLSLVSAIVLSFSATLELTLDLGRFERSSNRFHGRRRNQARENHRRRHPDLRETYRPRNHKEESDTLPNGPSVQSSAGSSGLPAYPC